MTRSLLVLYNDTMRNRAIEMVKMAEKETRVTFDGPKRTLPQNARMWMLLSLISDTLLWHGAKWSPEHWKDYFMHSLHGELWMPHEDGGMIPVGRSTSNLSIRDHSDLTTLIEAFCARQGITIPERETA